MRREKRERREGKRSHKQKGNTKNEGENETRKGNKHTEKGRTTLHCFPTQFNIKKREKRQTTATTLKEAHQSSALRLLRNPLLPRLYVTIRGHAQTHTQTYTHVRKRSQET